MAEEEVAVRDASVRESNRRAEVYAVVVLVETEERVREAELIDADDEDYRARRERGGHRDPRVGPPRSFDRAGIGSRRTFEVRHVSPPAPEEP